MSLLAVVAVVLGLAGGSTLATTTAAPAKSCTEIGCRSGLKVDWGGLPAAHPNVSRAKICIQGRCRVMKRRAMKQSYLVIEAPLKAGTSRVTYVARGRRGKVIARGSTNATSTSFQPNGEGCPPICVEFLVHFFEDGSFRWIPPTY